MTALVHQGPRTQFTAEDPQTLFKRKALFDALRAALVTELDATLRAVSQQAGDLAECVHSARKHLKRWRALFKLLPHPVRSSLARELSVIRLVARRLGRVRDPVARLESWRKFVGRRNACDELAGVTAVLDRQARELAAEPIVRLRLSRVERALLAARPRVLQVLHARTAPRNGSILTVSTGLRRSYRKGRRALAEALEHTADETLHELRRATKEHQYQLQFLEPLWKKPLKAQRSEASDLSDILGEHHDLASVIGLLRGEAAHQPLAFFGALEQLDHWQEDLEQQAFAAAALVFAEPPAALQRRITRYFASSVPAL